MAKRKLHQEEHPIDAYPFEAFYNGSWRNVEFLKIKDGTTVACFEHLGCRIEEKIPVTDLRMKSRKAIFSDCTSFLRPRVDICVLSTYPSETGTACIDAKISSIKRKPHEFKCTCQFYISFSGVKHPPGSAHKEGKAVTLDKIAILQQLGRKPCGDESYRWSYSKDCPTRPEAKLRGQFVHDTLWMLVASSVKGVEFEVRSMEGKIVYRVVDGDQDMFPFNSDKIVKTINFRSGEDGVMRPNARTFLPALAGETTDKEKNVVDSHIDLEKDELKGPSLCNIVYVRRSKRRHVQPDRFVGDGSFRPETKRKRKEVEASSICLREDDRSCDDTQKHQFGSEEVNASEDHANLNIIVAPDKTDTLEPRNGVGEVVHASENQTKSKITVSASKTVRLKHQNGVKKVVAVNEKRGNSNIKEAPSKIGKLEHRNGVENVVDASENHANGDTIEAPSENRLGEVKADKSNGRTHITGKAENNGKITTALDTEGLCGQVRRSNDLLKKKNRRVKFSESSAISYTSPPITIDYVLYQKDHPEEELVANSEEKFGTKPPKGIRNSSVETQRYSTVRRRSVEVEKGLKENSSRPGKKEKGSKKIGSNSSCEEKGSKDIWANSSSEEKGSKENGPKSSGEGKGPKKIGSKSRNVEKGSKKIVSRIVKREKQLKEIASRLGERKKGLKEISSKLGGGKKQSEKTSSSKELGVRRSLFSSKKTCSERRTYMRKLLSRSEYKELIERCMKNIDSETQKPQLTALSQWEILQSKEKTAVSSTSHTKNQEESPELEDLWKQMEASLNSIHFLEKTENNVPEFSKAVNERSCEHDFVLNEEIGLVCRFCRHVGTEIRYVFPPLFQSRGRIRDRERYVYDQDKYLDDSELDLTGKSSSSKDLSVQDEHESVWTLIPDLRSKLHFHQKKAFEFLWRNLAGSLMPKDMNTFDRKSGCVISHSPGAGKTFLMISFLTSYLKLFPYARPLILAPKTILHTWFKEFKKWEVPIPVYLIHGRRNYKKELADQSVADSPSEFKTNRDVLHVVDCLEKVQKWHEGPSVLLMGYPSFLSLMRENSMYEHWNYMARVLRKSTGLLILDEGHNPRSTRSRLRKLLMNVKTDQRILLSGTIFQNNFEEYFNTLCLARPRFISEVITKMAPIEMRKRLQKKVTRRFKEKLARKVFVDKIAQRINSKVEQERKLGLHMLKNLTMDFIDVYEGGTSDILPGLQTYKLLLKPSPVQQALLARLQKGGCSTARYPIELELLITLVTIHPWLVTTLGYASRYYTSDEFKEIEKYKADVKVGSKVWFVVSLIHRCIIKREKVLIFCRNIAPINLFVEILEIVFGWTKGEEVLVLQGDQELYERGKVIDKFEEPSGASQVLIASIAACSEGISLTAASRVVLLDSEWNPSKTKQAVARAFRPGQERVVYVYQLLTAGTMEVDKYGRNSWKEKVARMIVVGSGMEDSSCRQADKIDDEVLREIADEDQTKTFHMIMKEEKFSDSPAKGKEGALLPFK